MACGSPLSKDDDPGEVIENLSRLYRLKKASHLSWAARFPDGTELKGDGGESGAGRCILDTMRNMNAVNCLVLVARWYGGKHLGGLRFRIYRKISRKLFEQ